MLVAEVALATVTSSTRTVTHEPETPTTVFAITYKFLASDWIKVTKINEATQAETTLVQGSEYSVSLPTLNTNGSITTTSSIGAGFKVRIERIVPFTQTTSFRTQSSYSPILHENAFDKLTMIAQDLRAVAGSDGTSAVNTHVGLSDPHTQYALLAGRSGGQHFIGGTASGNNLQLSSTSHGTKGKVILGGNGSELVVDDVNNRVGIGTSTPSFMLDVAGHSQIAGMLLNGGNFSNDNDGDTLSLWGGTISGTNPALIWIRGPTHATEARKIFIQSNYVQWLGASSSSWNFDMDMLNGVFTGNSGTVLQFNTLRGSSSSGGDLLLTSTSDATKGNINIGASSTFDEVNTRLGIGTTSPSVALQVHGEVTGRQKSIAGGASYTVTAPNDCDAVVMTATNNAIITLPDAAAANDRCRITVINTAADGAALISVQPHSSDGIYGSCVGVTGAGAATVVQFSGTNNKAVNNTLATQNKGDYWIGVSDGTGGWYTIGCVGEWASTP
jgi:hypothetical protein